MKLSRLAATCLGFIATLAPGGAADASGVPPPWQHQDIGAVTLAGTASAAQGVFTASGTLDIWGTSDGCHFVWQTLEGDGAIIARIVSIERTHNHAKAGLAMRESLSADARHVSWVATPTDGAQFLVREQPGGATTSRKKAMVEKAMPPVWLKLLRAGDTFSTFQSPDGKTWAEIDSVTLELAKTLQVGLVASSHQKDALSTAKFDGVGVSRAGKMGR